jgi:hypothetical protein
VHALQSVNGSRYHLASYGWLKYEPRLAAPILVLAVVAVLAGRPRLRNWRTDTAGRFCAGAWAYLAFLCVSVGIWEFLFNGAILETSYYFSVFTTGVIIVLGAALFMTARRGRLSVAGMRLIALGSALGAALPSLLLVGGGVKALDAPRADWVIVVVIASAFGAALATRILPIRLSVLAALLAAPLIVFAVNLSSDASASTRSVFGGEGASYVQRADALRLTTGLIRFMQRNDLQRSTPAFWINTRDERMEIGMQAAYFWETTQIGIRMPRLGAAELRRLRELRPEVLVLFCKTRDCGTARPALARRGYRTRPLAEQLLRAGSHRLWVEALGIPEFAQTPRAKALEFYRTAQGMLTSNLSGAIAFATEFHNALGPD